MRFAGPLGGRLVQSAGPFEAHASLQPLVDLAAEGLRPGGEKLGAVVDRKSVPPARGGTSAEAAAFFEDEHAFAGGAQFAGGGQSGQAGSDDEDVMDGGKRGVGHV